MQPVLKVHVIASGSKGNATVVEDTRTGHGVLIDCGVSKKALFEGCAQTGFDLQKLDAITITHEHSDHTKGLGVVVRGLAKKGIAPALFVNSTLLDASADIAAVADDLDVRSFATGTQFSVSGLQLYPFETSHDASFSCGFRIGACAANQELDAVGFMTDTGVVTPQAHEALSRVRLLALESNHDANMLAHGPYPAYLKRRIAAERGHLSNDQAASELRSLLSDELRGIVAMHISENNNTYRLPREALSAVLAQEGLSAQVDVLVGYQKLPVTLQ